MQKLFGIFSKVFDLINDIKANSDKFRDTIKTVIKNQERKKIDNGTKLKGGKLNNPDEQVKKKLEKEKNEESGLSKSIQDATIGKKNMDLKDIEENLRNLIIGYKNKYNNKLTKLKNIYDNQFKNKILQIYNVVTGKSVPTTSGSPPSAPAPANAAGSS